MPQLMPLFWKFSVLFSFLFLVMMMMFFGSVTNLNKMELSLDKKIQEKWYW